MNYGNVQKFSLAVGSINFILICFELPALIGLVDYSALIGAHSTLRVPYALGLPTTPDPELLKLRRYAHQTGSARGGDAAASYHIPESDMTPFQWDAKYDRNGFRNERDLQSADMVVIGDSFVEAMTVANAELVTSQLARLQGKIVANLGQSGYGPLQELVVLQRYALPLHPHTVVWMFFEGNDLQDVIFYRLMLEHPPTLRQAFWKRSFTRNAYLAVKRLFKPPVKTPGTQRAGICQGPDGRQLTTYFAYRSRALSPEELSALDETARAFATAYKLCAAQGIRLLIVFIPTKFRVLHSLCQFPPESQCSKWLLNDLPARLPSALRSASLDIGYLDLTSYLVEAARTEGLPYYRDDEHWSPEGHKVAAKAINDYILSTSSQEAVRQP